MASKTTNYNLDMPGYDEIADIDVINGNMDKIDVQMKKNADSAQQSKDIVSDEYSATNTYAVGDYCIHENVLYKCKTAITTGEEFDSNKWVQTTCGTEFKELNSNLADYGLDNKFDSSNCFNGFYGVTITEKAQDNQYISSDKPFNVSSGDTVRVSVEYSTFIQVGFYNASGNRVSYIEKTANEVNTVVPNDTTQMIVTVKTSTPNFRVYINNEIDSIKNDLGGLSFSVSGTTLSITDGTNTWTLTQ